MDDTATHVRAQALKRRMIAIHPLTDLSEKIEPGIDLPLLLRTSLRTTGLLPLRADDVLVVTQKIVSKAEGQFVDLDDVTPGDEAVRLAAVTCKEPRLVELVLREASHVVRAAPHVLITRHRLGHVMANSKIDQSNIGPGGNEGALLLPVDPDLSAKRLREALRAAGETAPPSSFPTASDARGVTASQPSPSARPVFPRWSIGAARWIATVACWKSPRSRWATRSRPPPLWSPARARRASPRC